MSTGRASAIAMSRASLARATASVSASFGEASVPPASRGGFVFGGLGSASSELMQARLSFAAAGGRKLRYNPPKRAQRRRRGGKPPRLRRDQDLSPDESRR